MSEFETCDECLGKVFDLQSLHTQAANPNMSAEGLNANLEARRELQEWLAHHRVEAGHEAE